MCIIKKKDFKIIISSNFEVILLIRVLLVVNHTHSIKYPDENGVLRPGSVLSLMASPQLEQNR